MRDALSRLVCVAPAVGGTLANMGRRPHEPAYWRELAQLVAAGDLRGDAAEEAVVDLITASEVGRRDHPRVRFEIREQVRAVVREDRELLALLHERSEGDARPEPAVVVHDRKRARVPRRERSGRPAKPEPDTDGVDAFAAGQTRRRVLTAVGVVVALVGGVTAWTALREKPCESLARKICLALDECRSSTVRASLKSEGIDDARCEATKAAIDQALAGVDPAKAQGVFTRVMTQELGFDPRGVAEAKPAKDGRAREPATIVEGVATLGDLFADEAHLLWTRQNPPGVFRVRSIGGTPEPLSEHPDPIDVFATQDFVYWVSRGPTGGTLWTDKKRGEYEPMPIEVEGFTPLRAAFMGPELAFVDAATGAIVIAAVAGGEPRVVAAGELPPPRAIAGDDAHVFWVTGAGAVMMAARSGGDTRVLAQGQRDCVTLMPDATHLYWIDRGQGSLVRVPKTGGALETLVSGRPGLWDLALDGQRIYATDRDAGMVICITKSDAALTVIAEGLAQPTAIVVDGAAVYWEAGGMIARLPK